MPGENATMMLWAAKKAAIMELKSSERTTFMMLASYSDFGTGEGIAASQLTLADDTGSTDRTIRRSISTLWDLGLLDGGDESRSYNGTVVYNLVMDDARRKQLAFERLGLRAPSEPKPRRKRRWGKPVETVEKSVDKPVDNVPADVTPPDMVSINPGHEAGHSVRLPVNLKEINQEPAVPASPEVMDHAAVAAAFRAEIRERRLAKQGYPSQHARTSSEAEGQSSPAGMQSRPTPSPAPAIHQSGLPVDLAPARPQAQALTPAAGSAPAPAGSSPAAEPASAPRVPSVARSVTVPAPGKAPGFAVPASFLRLPGLSPSAVPRAPRTDTRRLLGTGCR